MKVRVAPDMAASEPADDAAQRPSKRGTHAARPGGSSRGNTNPVMTVRTWRHRFVTVGWHTVSERRAALTGRMNTTP